MYDLSINVAPNDPFYFWRSFRDSLNYLEVPPKQFKKRFLALGKPEQHVCAVGLQAFELMAQVGLAPDSRRIEESLPLLFESMEKGEAPSVIAWSEGGIN
ncbi:MAG: hypothetical protein AAF959_04600 [Cyanobacteria bacterium P01_D01_bin.56]